MAAPISHTFLKLGYFVFMLGMVEVVRAHKIETEVKCSADEFFNLFRHNMTQLPKLAPQIMKGVQVLKGDGKGVGTVRLWKYVLGTGPTLMVKETVIAIDEEKKSMTLKALDGDIMKHCKSFDLVLNVFPKEESDAHEESVGSYVRWSLNCGNELNEYIPSPDGYKETLALLSTNLGQYLHFLSNQA